MYAFRVIKFNNLVNGLKNIQITYNDDRNFYCDIDTLIGSVFARLAQIYERDNIYINEDTKVRIKAITQLHNPKKVVNKPVDDIVDATWILLFLKNNLNQT